MDPRAVALRLIKLAAEAEPIEVEVEQFPLTENEEQTLAQKFGVRRLYLARAERMLGELQ